MVHQSKEPPLWFDRPRCKEEETCIISASPISTVKPAATDKTRLIPRMKKKSLNVQAREKIQTLKETSQEYVTTKAKL